ncbi:MAG: hypothetical protein ACR2F8_04065 [Caulobacteraceae bacterium]
MPAIPAIIGGVAALGGALISSSAASNASDQAAQTAAANNALQAQIYGSNKALAQPYIDRGNAAGSELSGFLGLGGDPAASQAALNTYLNSTGYKFNFDQGQNAVTSDKAAAGLLNSGSTLKALDQFGTGLADQYGQQYVGNLQNLTGTGESAVNALSNTGANYANAVSSNNNNAAQVSANAGLASANQINGLIGNAFSAYGAFRGGSSFGSGNGGSGSSFNPFAPTGG